MATVTEVVRYGSSPAVPTRSSLSSVLKPTISPSEVPIRTLPQPTVESLLRSASEGDGQTLSESINGEATIVQNTPTTPTRPLKISLPNLSRRISLLQATGGARLSPTIIHRPPPLPILNLPKLPTMLSNSEDTLAEGSSLSRRRSERVGLGSMPALPIQGTLRGAGAHEEPDDMEDEDDEEMDDIDEEATDDDERSYSHGADDDDARGSHPGTATSDTDSGSGFSDEGLNSRGSYDLASPSEASGSFARRNTKPQLPPLILASPLDIRFQASFATSSTFGMVHGAGSTGWDKKGKQSVVVPSPLSSGYMGSVEGDSAEPSARMGTTRSQPSRPSLLVSTPRSSYHSCVSVAEGIAFSRSEGSDKTPSAQQRPDPFLNARTQSPLNTPRALSPIGSPTSNGNWERNSMFVQRPSFYKRASRSLIDLHSVATKEAIEKMMREEEEKQERVRRQMSLSRNAGTNAEGVGGASRNATLRNSLVGETLPNRAHEAGGTRILTMQAYTAEPDALGGVAGPSNAAETSNLTTTGTSSMAGGIRSSMVDAVGSETKQQNRISMAPAYEVAMGMSSPNPLQAPLRRRRSMPTYNEATSPPPYPSFAPYPYGRHAGLQISPREDEGREELPSYSNPIYLKAIMPRKMEFSEPGIQAKDRKWRRVLCVLEGTMFKVYRCPVGPGGVSAIEQWWERKVGAGDVATYPTGPGSTAAAPPRPGSSRQAPNAGVDTRSREEEKADQQYLRYPVQRELSVNGGSETPEDEDEDQSMSRSQRSNAPTEGAHRRTRLPHPPPAQIAITKSALNLAVHFLKPGSRHGRSSSDAGPPSPSASKPVNTVPRSSLNLPRAGTATPASSSFSSTSRSHSPLPSASSSSLSVPHGSRSHSPMPSSSRLNVPSSSSSASSRPATPSTGSSSGRPAPRMRNHDTQTPPRSARSDSTSKSDEVPDPHEHDLIRCYTMQHAESGLGNDYVKRKNVIRVRLEGEQFLLQAKDVPSVVQWIEVGFLRCYISPYIADAWPVIAGPSSCNECRPGSR